MPDIVIAFFAFGLIAGLLKSDLKVPQSIYETLSILLMLVLGLKGGMALHGQAHSGMVTDLLVVGALGLIIPLICYPLLRYLVRLNNADSVSIAAHYGSVSAGTFAVVLAIAEKSGMPLLPETTLYLVMLELPAIVIMLGLYGALKGKGKQAHIWHEALTSRGVLLLGGGVLIGYLYGPEGLAPIAPALIGGFKTMLALFLLEMGLCTAKVCNPLPLKHWRLMLFAALAPFALGALGLFFGLLLDLPQGTLLVLTTLAASASYIAAPAAVRASIPDANIGLAMLASLGITFPVNVLLAIPVYQYWVELALKN
ncbi:sodium-dependent bicarbonate transport family permease [Rheinheimera sediminis]|uniref:sodium-dependent bicarbonate transport family permease n=1 Tax=Rheinheimera sp. YQF-1 TaxID=2499626 RepID=UPI000FDA4D8F|nr:sodium-dependent bicarbonate transport family permease [Rheinheimera sp. YQF-1]RVT47364.1 sodium-dependent bicarbonate transport family permease [Rheinheimera sp. YQF-1]